MENFRKSLLAVSLAAAATLMIAGCSKKEEPAPVAPVVVPSVDVVVVPAVIQVTDADLQTNVMMALVAEDMLKGASIVVEVLKGDVRLAGALDDQAQITKAVEIASQVQGVHAIHNELTLKM